MNILFIGSLCSPSIYDECVSKNISLDNPALTFQTSFLEGIHLLKDVELSTFSFPTLFSRKKIFVRGDKFSSSFSNNNICIKYLNIPGLKHLTAPLFASSSVKDINYNVDVIIIYAVQSFTLRIALDIKTKYPHCKIILMVPDLPEFMSQKQGKIYRLLKSYEDKLVKGLLHVVDGYILLSEYMKEKLPVCNKPYLIMEGIFNANLNLAKHPKSSEKIIFYTGNLDERYGILNLLDAFSKIPSKDYRLWIRGQGNTLPIIKERQKTDNRIVLWDYMSREKLFQLEKEATVLVNPVPPSQEFTKYFFPSKTMEYLASGTPTLMFRLACLPDEYHSHIYYFDKNTVECISEKIQEVCSKSDEELDSFGRQASEFIISEKNSKRQAERVIDFIKTL